MEKENLEQLKKPLASKYNVVFAVSLSIALMFLVLITNMIISKRKHIIDVSNKVSVESSLLRAANSILKCKEIGGSLIQPVDKYKGEGPICNLQIPEIKNEWPSMPITDGYRYQYRTINDKIITGGTDEKDMVSCSYDSGIKCDLL